MALLIVVFVVELFISYAIYYLLSKLFPRNYIALAIGACLVGLLAGWITGYRATGAAVTRAYLENASVQLQQERGIKLSIEDEQNLKKILFAKPEFEYLLHKGAAIHAVPAFFVTLLIILRRSKKHDQYKK